MLADTAGIRELGNSVSGHDSIENQGIALAREELGKSHGVVFVLDVTSLQERQPGMFWLTDELRQSLGQALAEADKPIVLLNKADLIGASQRTVKLVVSTDLVVEASLV